MKYATYFYGCDTFCWIDTDVTFETSKSKETDNKGNQEQTTIKKTD